MFVPSWCMRDDIIAKGGPQNVEESEADPDKCYEV